MSLANSTNFKDNIAVFGGGIFTDNSTFEFNDMNTFRGNQAKHTGGAIYGARSVLKFLGICSITANHATRDGGGIYIRDGSAVNPLGLSYYQGNSAHETGGGISAFQSSFNLGGHSTFNNNHAVEGGGLYAFKSTVSVPGETTFVTNSVSNHGGGFTINHGTLHQQPSKITQQLVVEECTLVGVE